MPFLRLLFAATFVFAHCPASAQVDTEFWFAPPEITSGHGDSPIYLRISTLDASAVVKVTQPAMNNRVLANRTIAANQTETILLTAYRTELETSYASVMKTGLKIESTAPVTAYYEVGSSWNSDIFALKGRNSIGNRFVIPAQNFYDNSSDYQPLPYSSFDIVATKNNTVVKVKPAKALFGHEADTLIIIKLNAGETYSLRKINHSASSNPAGTIVESNKPIAITLKDDSVINQGCRDMLGDQLVPVEVAGKEYIVQLGFLGNQEFLFVTAIHDNTSLFINGSASASAILRAGEVYRYPISTKSTYITGSEAFYVFHVTGFGCEMGMAILPSINCKGSEQIGFSRSTHEFFGLNILVRKDGIEHFRLNGSETLVPASAFSAVPGTNDTWYTAQLSFITTQIPVGFGSIISNDANSFQVGIINGDAATTCKYGYFSSFSTLYIGDDFAICEGETAVLDAGGDKESYEWSTGATSSQLIVTEPGKYWVKTVKEECVLYDTVLVDVKVGKVDIVETAGYCPGEKTKIDGKENFSWLWSDGSTGRYLETDVPGKFWVNVFDYTGCAASDTVYVSAKEAPAVNLGADVTKCPLDTFFVNATYPGATYLWSDGATSAQNGLLHEGEYWVKVSLDGCSSVDTIKLENLPGPVQDKINGSPSVCPFSQGIVYSTQAVDGSLYQWTVEGGEIHSNSGSNIEVNWSGANAVANIKLVVTDRDGCKGDVISFPVRVNEELIVEIPEGPDSLCLNNASEVLYTTPVTNGSSYHWYIEGGEVTGGQGSNAITAKWSEGVNKLWIVETHETTDLVCSGTSEMLTVHVYTDNSSAVIHAVSVDTALVSEIVIDWSLNGQAENNTVQLVKHSDKDETVTEIAPTAHRYVSGPNNTKATTYAFTVQFMNACAELITTPTHRTMLLRGEADSASHVISLSWNHYEGWPQGAVRYEIWRRLENNHLKMVTSVPGSSNTFSAALALDGFKHQYFIKAIENGGSGTSWSNPVEFTFTHPIMIPNVFTPNGDGKNDLFVIPNIEAYHNSDLVIFDRWGKKVYEAFGYKNSWNGYGLSSGVYYYVLKLNGKNRIYKGPVSILR